MRTLLGHYNTRDIANYVRDIVTPLWESMQLTAPPPGSDAVEQRLELACQRLEKAASSSLSQR